MPQLGSWRLIVWQPRWVYAELDALYYQKVNADDQPIGEAQRILFSDVTVIEQDASDEFEIFCGKRSYVFRTADAQIVASSLRLLCERWQIREEPCLIKNLDTGQALPLVSGLRISPHVLQSRTSPGSSLAPTPEATPTAERDVFKLPCSVVHEPAHAPAHAPPSPTLSAASLRDTTTWIRKQLVRSASSPRAKVGGMPFAESAAASRGPSAAPGQSESGAPHCCSRVPAVVEVKH